MDFPPSSHLETAIALQTLALPCTLLLCITSMLRERSISHHDEERLVRLYKQHAFVLELVQVFVALMACGFMAGNTVAAWEARSLVVDFASEDVTSAIVRYAIARNAWLSGSALCILTCMSMLDSWSLPHSLQDLTDPLFRLTREIVRGYICRHYDKDYEIHDCKRRSYDVEQPFSVSSTAAESMYIERSSNDTPDDPPEKTAEESKTTTTATTNGEPRSEEEINFPNAETLPDTPPPSLPSSPSKARASNNSSRSRTPSPSQDRTQVSHPPASRPHYQAQTLTSALRASSNAASKNRSRKRSVTFDISAKRGDGASFTQSSRERSLVRERVEEVERKLRGEDKEGGHQGNEEARPDVSVNKENCEDADGAKEKDGEDGGGESMFKDAVEVESEVVEE